MKLIYTKSKAPLSILIRKALGEPVSHFAIVFDNGFVFHSNLLGVHPEWFKTFTRKAEVVFQLEYDCGLEKEEEVWHKILENFDGKSYDYGGFFYWTVRLLLKAVLRVPIPAKNAWADPDEFLCAELGQVLPDEFLAVMPQTDLAITSPFQHYQYAKQALLALMAKGENNGQ